MEKPYLIDAEGLNDDWEEEPESRPAEAITQMPPVQTDEYALLMIKRAAIIRANRETALLTVQKSRLLVLEPTLHYGRYDGIYLSLRIGYEKLYVIKDLNEFIAAYTNGSSLLFGKNTHILPHRAAFEAGSLPLLDFAVRHFIPENYESDMRKRRITFTGAILDEFFGLFGNGCELKIDSRHYSDIKSGVYQLHREDIPVRFRLAEAPGGARLSAKDNYLCMSGRTGAYVMMGNEIYITSQEYSEKCKLFLENMMGMGGSAFFSAEDIPTLFISIITETSDCLRFEIDDSLYALNPEPLTTKIFFDLTGSGVTARVEFSYGEDTHYAFEKKYVSESHDLAGEERIERTISKYMGYSLSSPGTLLISNEEDLFALIDTGIDELSEIAEIYASEDFERIKRRNKPIVKVGFRTTGNLLEIDLESEFIDFDELVDALRLYRAGKKYKRMADGSFLAFTGSVIGDIAKISDALELPDEKLISGTVGLPSNNIPFVDGLIKDCDVVRIERDETFRRVIRDMHNAEDADCVIPEAFVGVLRNYQAVGYRWLNIIDALRFGGVLADDMGLGKTIQILTLLENARLSEGSAVSIVICPASVVLNWAAEAERFAPNLRVTALTGGREERERIVSDISAFDMIVTSYSQLTRDIGLYEGTDFRYIILDEAQFIKNHTIKSARAVKLLRGRTRYALTGTPVENNLAELWSIFDFIMPGYLHGYNKFRARFETPIAKDSSNDAIRRLRAMVRPFLLRRLKKDVLKELPEKTETVLYSSMAAEQRKLYLTTMLRARDELADKLAGLPGSQGKIEILAALTKLRQICCDPSLVYDGYKEKSAKLSDCLELINNCVESGHRILLFSQFTSMLAILRGELEHLKIEYSYLDGATPKHERHALMGAFNGGSVPVFLISLKAGGTGLNLTGADIVIHYDPWWNVSAENQATDRAHRIGQERNVQVFKLIAKDSIEEKIIAIQERKKTLADSVVRAGENTIESLSREELLSLFNE
jgi:SNF2 family DNA or RNA helicase